MRARNNSLISRPECHKKLSLNVNKTLYEVEVAAHHTLAEVLREQLGLTGTKIGCNRAECGSCTVLLDGQPVYSCTILAVEAARKNITTIEGLKVHGKLHPIQEAFIANDALQCGYCIPGMILSVKALLDVNQNPTAEDVKHAIAGNYCRCGSQPNIVVAALAAAKMMKEGR